METAWVCGELSYALTYLAFVTSRNCNTWDERGRWRSGNTSCLWHFRRLLDTVPCQAAPALRSLFSLGYLLFHLFIYNRTVLLGFLPWEIRVAFLGESQLRQSRATQPTVRAGCFSVSIIQRVSDMDYGIFNGRTDAKACGCTRGCTDTVRESALKADCGRKLPCRTGESNLRERHAGPTFY